MRKLDREVARLAQRSGGARERSYLSMVPWRNFRRAALLLLALGTVVALKRTGGDFFHRLLESFGPPKPAPVETTVHMRAGPPGR